MQKTQSSGMGILFLVVLIDLIGLTLVIPFLTYFIQDLATGDGLPMLEPEICGWASYWPRTPLVSSYSHPSWGLSPIEWVEAPSS
ncbi:MAG: hypothetical protein Ct9H90mP16_05200 [Candidatus Poseidoniales archaeon]|nr:MAG: hypothetical protein Ct9H90mP16_05200 [Candidatus Poseidoniales archaeon]